jgi:urease gamma subunit
MENNAGRPEYKKTDEDAKNVEALTIAGVPQKLVSKILKISEPTLRKHYRDELDTSKAKANAVISQSLFKLAREGNVTAQIFWLKTQAGWKETNHVELTGKDGDKLFDEPKQLIEIRRVFDEIKFTEPENITKPSELVQDSKREPENTER